jgi:hypothetical protein
MGNRVLRDTTDSEVINSLSWEAEVFFYRLIMKADDYGNFHGNIQLVRAALFPLRISDCKLKVNDGDVAKWITECEKSGLIAIYGVEKKSYLHILDFGQKLRRMRRIFPEPPIDAVFGQLAPTLANCGKSAPETETETETETEIELEGGKNKKKHLPAFRIRDQIIPMKISEYLMMDKNKGNVEQFAMNNDSSLMPHVLAELDKGMPHFFNDEAHVFNKFRSTYRDMAKKKAAPGFQGFTDTNEKQKTVQSPSAAEIIRKLNL